MKTLSRNFACREMTLGQLKSSHFQKQDGVNNSKLCIFETTQFE